MARRSDRVLATRGDHLEMLAVGTVKPNDLTSKCRIRNTLTGDVSDPIPLQVALKWGYWTEPPEKGEKARGRGGKYGRWRTLKDGRPVFVTGGVPVGGLSVRTGSGMMDRTLFDTFGDVEPAKVDKLIHDFEELPSWATRDIAVVEVYERDGERFTAGGEEFQTGMDYDHTLGRIRIFQANEELSEVFTNEGIYHEVGHNLDKRWKDTALEEQRQSFREHRDWYGDRMVFKEEHRQDMEKAYPLFSARRRFLQAWKAGEDGITSYSSAWAREDRSGETIAEFARYYFGGYSRGGAAVSRRNVMTIGDEKGAPNLARAFADAMEGLAKERRG